MAATSKEEQLDFKVIMTGQLKRLPVSRVPLNLKATLTTIS